ncbi:MAG: SMP-30/gluconolactonase/LRE family protein, partial [Opitutaceae bacterium]|nr:SMP-30/gluconolactonase/LRE family protein [Opitutaceae bacterium]
VTVGKTLTLTASATGNPAPAYQWQVSTDGGATWTDIENAAASSCTIDPVTADMNGWHYRYSATNHAGSQTSNAATITVRPAWFDTPSAIVVDQAGNIYVTDAAAHVIRSITNDGRVDVFTGQLSTPGTATGAKTSTRLNTPSGLSIAPNKTLRFTDRTQRVRIANESGATDVFVGSTNNTGLVDGYRTSARFNNPSAIVTDSKGTSYVADSGNHAIRRISVDSALGGNVVTIAGAGAAGAVDATTGTLASFDSPSGLVLDEIAQLLYVADTGNHVIRVIDLANSNYPVTLHAGQFGVTGASDGEGLTEALFNSPHGLALDGGDLYVADTDNSTIRHIQANGRVSTVAGSAGSHGFADGPGADATFNHPVAVAVDASGNLYVLDTGNAALRKIAPDGTVSSPALTDYWIPEPPPASSTNGGGATTVWFALAPAVLIAIRMRKQ